MLLSVPMSSRALPRVAVLALIAVAAAGCADSARFGSQRSAYYHPSKNAEVTGSIARRPAATQRVVSQPLPAPSKPATVAAHTAPRSYGVASGAQGFGAYRPARRGNDITGSVPTGSTLAPQPSGHWTWNGGKAVALTRGQTLASLSREYHVPLSAILRVNNIANPRDLKLGQRIVIPRWVGNGQGRVAAAPVAHAPQTRVAAQTSNGNVHVVGRGETLIGIARRNGMSLSELAHYNHISPFTKLNVGDRVNVPGGRRQQVASRTPAPAPAPKIERPRTEPVQTVAAVPTEKARVARQEPAQVASQNVTQKAEPAGGIPEFRWPVKGRIIARFGREPNGTQNDGINLAVPEGTPIKAAGDGVVAYAGNELKGYGNLVLIRHSDGYVTAYANASKLLVSRGDSVRRGQVIARAGQTGNVNSPQLHFEIRKGSQPVDPTKYLGS